MLSCGAAQSQVLPYFVLDTFTYSEPYSIQHALNGGEEPFTGGDTVLTHNWGEIGVSYKGIGIGYLQRYDYDLLFSEDTAEFNHLITNKEPLPEGRTYDLRLEARNYRTEGVRLSYDFNLFKKLRINLGGAYLKGLYLTEGQAQGYATVLNEGDYDFQFDVDYYYSKDFLFDRSVEQPQGYGYSLDFYIDWEILRGFNLKLRGIDVLGELYWDHAPNTTATATSDIKEYDRNGYLVYQPVISGYETYQEYTQKLNPRYRGALEYSWTRHFATLAQAYSFYAEDFYQLGVRYNFNVNTNVHAMYMLDTAAVSLGWEMSYFNLVITSDSLNVDKAHTFGLSLNILTDF